MRRAAAAVGFGMKAWGPREPKEPDREDAAEAAARRTREREEKIRAIEEAGIDLDPRIIATRRGVPQEPGAGQPDPLHAYFGGHPVHDHAHPHPHVQSSAGEPPVIGIVGAGAVGTAL